MVLQARDAGAFPIVGTIPPVNPSYVDRDATARNDWVSRMNDLVRAMATQERAPIAEIHGDFLKQPSLPALFEDDMHPNDLGYRADRAVLLRRDHEAAVRLQLRPRADDLLRAPRRPLTRPSACDGPAS